MKKKVISLLLISAMTASMVAGCGDSSSSDTQKGDSKSATTVDDGHTLTVWAWDASFNIPALQAAADDYKANVDKDFVLNIEEQSQSSDIETATTTPHQCPILEKRPFRMRKTQAERPSQQKRTLGNAYGNASIPHG